MENRNLNSNANSINISIPELPRIAIRKECRYCLSDDRLEKLIDPCNCEGTMKYVHQDCLEEWIKNGNKQSYEIVNDKKLKVYTTICEICKYQMRYTKSYKYNIFRSIYKLLKTVFGNMKNACMLVLHSVVVYFLIKRLKLFYNELLLLFKKSFSIFNPAFFISLTHNITVLASILLGINDIYMFYNKLLMEKRKCLINFLPKKI